MGRRRPDCPQDAGVSGEPGRRTNPTGAVQADPTSPFGPAPSPAGAASGADRILTREIVYTGLTRARKRVTILTDGEAFFAACRRRVRRTSGL